MIAGPSVWTSALRSSTASSSRNCASKRSLIQTFAAAAAAPISDSPSLWAATKAPGLHRPRHSTARSLEREAAQDKDLSRHDDLIERVLSRAGLDLDAVAEVERRDSRARKLAERRRRPPPIASLHPADSGWRRSGLAWKVRRGSMSSTHALPPGRGLTRRRYATRRSGDDRSQDEVRPGDLVHIRGPLGDATWCLVLPSPASDSVQAPSAVDDQGRPVDGRDIWLMNVIGEIQPQRVGSLLLRIPGCFAQSPELQEAKVSAAEADLALSSIYGGIDALQALATPELVRARVALASHLRHLLRGMDEKVQLYRPHLFRILADTQLKLLDEEEIEVATLARLLEESVARPRQRKTAGSTASSTSSAQVINTLATHRLMLTLPEHFVFDVAKKSWRHSHTFSVRPERERKVKELVQAWLERAYSHPEQTTPLSRFIEKAKKRLQAGEMLKWDETDTTVLAYLTDSLTDVQEQDLYLPGVMHILKACGRIQILPPAPFLGPGPCTDVGDFDWEPSASIALGRRETEAFLREMEVFVPHEIVDWSLAAGTSRRFLEGIAQRARIAEADKRWSNSREVDYDQHLREDFKGLVYVLDDASAHELDDGVSVEPADDGTKHWVHVHIADPTSHLLPTDLLAVNAAQQSESVYLPTGHVPLFPPGFAQGVASKDTTSEESRKRRRVLTFSALVNSEGETEATDVKVNSIAADDMQVMTYEDANGLLEGSDSGQRTDGVKSEASVARIRCDLTKLSQVARSLSQARARNGAFAIDRRQARLSLQRSSLSSTAGEDSAQIGASDALPLLLPSSLTLFEPESILPPLNGGKMPDLDGWRNKGNEQEQPLVVPRYQISADTQVSLSRGTAQSLVAECMILAGRVAADFVWKRGGASTGAHGGAPYRIQELPSDVARSWKAIIAELVAASPTNAIADGELLRHGIVLSPASYSSEPKGHLAMGISGPGSLVNTGNSVGSLDGEPRDILLGSGYARATSPLRRYEDLVTHWQIKAALHRERPASKGRQKQWRGWKAAEMELMLPMLQRRSERAKELSLASQRFWTYKALQLVFDGQDTASSQKAMPADSDPAQLSTALPPARSRWQPVDKAMLSEPLLAAVSRPQLKVKTLDQRCTVRVVIPSLGGLPAECLWPVRLGKRDRTDEQGKAPPKTFVAMGGGTLESTATDDQILNLPTLGQQITVRIGKIITSGVGGGDIFCECVDEGATAHLR